MNMNILVGCEESQEVCKAFRTLGHQAYSCDLLPCSGGHPEWHLQFDVLKAIKAGRMITQSGDIVNVPSWDIGIFFPECTYLTVTANRWLKDQPKRPSGVLVGYERRRAKERAVNFFMKLVKCGIPKIAIENPVGCMSTRYRNPDQIINPFQFGHKEQKKTCLWLHNLPPLKPTKVVKPEEYHVTKSGKNVPKWFFYADKSKGMKERQKIRSKTFSGIADAMASQWS